MLSIKKLFAERSGKQILNGIDLQINPGEIHALMGPNGSGKSTLSLALMGHPEVEIKEGQVNLDGKDILEMEPNERSLAGLFLAFQYPVEIPGVPYIDFLRLIYNNVQKAKGEKELSPFKFRKVVAEKLADLRFDEGFLNRNLNEGFSGGEKKKSEILQMALLQPKYVILDETDSGLDVSALKIVAEGAREFAKTHKMGILVITHYKRMLEYLNPTHVHVLIKGKIVESGGAELAEELDKNGYERFLSQKVEIKS